MNKMISKNKRKKKHLYEGNSKYVNTFPDKDVCIKITMTKY